MTLVSRLVIDSIVCLISILSFRTRMIIWLTTNFFTTSTTEKSHIILVIELDILTNTFYLEFWKHDLLGKVRIISIICVLITKI